MPDERGVDFIITKSFEREVVVPVKPPDVKRELPSLPFTYERTDDPNKAQYSEWRVSPVRIAGEESIPATDEEIIEAVRKKHENSAWYTRGDWREKGIPQEQVELTINGNKKIIVYNYNKEKSFTDEHVQRAMAVLQELYSRFPQILDRIDWILINDVQMQSILADDERLPTNGFALPDYKAFELMPRGLDLIPHRIAAVTNFEGTFVHELTHLIQKEFEIEWRKHFKWNGCDDFPDQWELRKIPNGEFRYFDRHTGEMSPQFQFPQEPELCITSYAKQNMGEDICDSMVGYIYDPDLLQRVSSTKYGILKQHDKKSAKPLVTSKRIPKDQIKLPEVKPATVYYYVDEEKP